jgi:hypothetical protein
MAKDLIYNGEYNEDDFLDNEPHIKKMLRSKRAEIKLSSFMIALIMVGVVVVFFVQFMGAVSSNYSLTFDNSTYAAYNQLNAISNTTEQIKGQTLGIQEKSGLLDILGSYFSDGYKSVKLTIQSFSFFDKMNNAAMDSLNLGASGVYLRVAITAIVIILLVVGVIVSALVKWPL